MNFLQLIVRTAWASLVLLLIIFNLVCVKEIVQRGLVGDVIRSFKITRDNIRYISAFLLFLMLDFSIIFILRTCFLII